MPRLPPLPDLLWDADVPHAATFDDVYFSRGGGLSESEAVFLAGCGLPEAWRARDRFAICELGFGSGLNILATLNAWKKTRLPHAQLHISSLEAFPLAETDAARALAQFPDISDIVSLLLQHWPVRAYASQRIWFDALNASLTLHIGEAETILPGMTGAFDAWFLDGFAPARNPAMWTETIVAEIARLSAPNARLATFTVAGDVRRRLQRVGFEVSKRPGFGAKRERLEARLNLANPSPQGRKGETIYPYAAANSKRVAIIGSGIAGASTALALTRRGVEVIVLEQASDIAAGASGNPAGLVMPRLDRDGPLRAFFLAAYIDAIRTYEALGEGIFTPCGVEELPRETDALADLLSDPPLPEDWFAAMPSGAALHARAGLVRPRAAIEAFLRSADVRCGVKVRAIETTATGVILRSSAGDIEADATIIASGAALAHFEPSRFIPIERSRGQIEWAQGAHIERAITRGSYAAPFDGGVLFGATFDRDETPEADARARNLAVLAELAPDIAARIDANSLHSRASWRATTPDRAPVAGLLPIAEAWLEQYAAIANGREPSVAAPPPAHRGVYVIGGLGARGLTFAPLLGERLASEICGEPQLLQCDALDALHPARFLHRALKRKLI